MKIVETVVMFWFVILVFVAIVCAGVVLVRHDHNLKARQDEAALEACYPAQVIEVYRLNTKGTKNVVSLCAPLVDGGQPFLVRKAWE